RRLAGQVSFEHADELVGVAGVMDQDIAHCPTVAPGAGVGAAGLHGVGEPFPLRHRLVDAGRNHHGLPRGVVVLIMAKPWTLPQQEGQHPTPTPVPEAGLLWDWTGYGPVGLVLLGESAVETAPGGGSRIAVMDVLLTIGDFS